MEDFTVFGKRMQRFFFCCCKNVLQLTEKIIKNKQTEMSASRVMIFMWDGKWWKFQGILKKFSPMKVSNFSITKKNQNCLLAEAWFSRDTEICQGTLEFEFSQTKVHSNDINKIRNFERIVVRTVDFFFHWFPFFYMTYSLK